MKEEPAARAEPRGEHTLGRSPFIIAVAGGTASGKTTVCQRITEALGDQSVVLLSVDEFYRDLTPEERTRVSELNFDEPAAIDIPRIASCLDALRRCEAVQVPVYDFVTSSRRPDETRHVKPADVVVIEGILALHIPDILARCNMRIFVDTDDDVRLARRIRRDIAERGRKIESLLAQYTRFVKPAFEKYVLPSKQNADIIIPWLTDNSVAVDLITEHIRLKLLVQDLRRVYSTLHLLPSAMQIRGMHTKIRCRMTSRTDFVFYADRLIRLVIEAALGMLPFDNTTVTTPSGDLYQGVEFCQKICGVSITRSAEAMENALRACCYGIKIGKVLIYREGDAGQSLAYEKLPQDIAERRVLLMDPILATGSSAVRAIELLTQHRSVDVSKIILLTLIAAPEGIHAVCSRFPELKVITSEIDEGTGPESTVRPGIGDFGDRYFGTTSCCDERLIALKPDGGAPAESARTPRRDGLCAERPGTTSCCDEHLITPKPNGSASVESTKTPHKDRPGAPARAAVGEPEPPI